MLKSAGKLSNRLSLSGLFASHCLVGVSARRGGLPDAEVFVSGTIEEIGAIYEA